MLSLIRYGYRDRDEAFLPEVEVYSRIDPRCEGCTFEEYEHRWIPENLTLMVFGAPLDSYPTFEAAEIAVTSGIGLASMILTLPIVMRRRPS